MTNYINVLYIYIIIILVGFNEYWPACLLPTWMCPSAVKVNPIEWNFLNNGVRARGGNNACFAFYLYLYYRCYYYYYNYYDFFYYY
jgi:hypothetical protein